MTFQEIMDCNTLRTLKNDPELLAYLYFKWRDVEEVKGIDGRPSKRMDQVREQHHQETSPKPEKLYGRF